MTDNKKGEKFFCMFPALPVASERKIKVYVWKYMNIV